MCQYLFRLCMRTVNYGDCSVVLKQETSAGLTVLWVTGNVQVLQRVSETHIISSKETKYVNRARESV